MPGYIVVAGLLAVVLSSFRLPSEKPSPEAWIRINLAGYKPGSVKVVVWASKKSAGLADLSAGGKRKRPAIAFVLSDPLSFMLR